MGYYIAHILPIVLCGRWPVGVKCFLPPPVSVYSKCIPGRAASVNGARGLVRRVDLTCACHAFV